MTQMADITVKKADNVTNIIYNQLVPSAGDGIPARWRVNALTTYPPAYRPRMDMLTKPNPGKNARQIELTFAYPVVRVVDGVDTKVGEIPLRMSGTLGDQYTDAEVAEAVHQFTNLAVSTLIVSSIKGGFSPT